MDHGKLHKFKLQGYDAILLDGRVEVSVPDHESANKIVMKMSGAVLDNKIKSLRINMPDKIIFISAKDKENILMRAEEPNDKKVMN
jgi:hypothetical protein